MFRLSRGPLVLLGVLLILGACRTEPVSPPPEPLDFETDPHILRGVWEGIGVSNAYRAPAFSPSGALFASATQNGVALRGVSTGESRLTLPRAKADLISFSPDDKLFVVREVRTLRVFSVSTGAVLYAVHVAGAYPSVLSFSPDGAYLIIDEDDRTHLWRVEEDGSLTTLHLLSEDRNDVGTAAFSPDSQYVLVAGSSSVRLWRVADGALVRRYGDEYASVAFGPDGSLYLGGDGEVRRLTRDGRLLTTFTFREGNLYDPVVSPDGRLLAGEGYDLPIWEVASGARVATLEGEPGSAYALTFAPDGGALYAASEFGEVTRYSLPSGDPTDLFRVEDLSLTLELKATYVDETQYRVTGTFRFRKGAPLPVEGGVFVDEGLEKQSPTPQTSPGCGFLLNAKEGGRFAWELCGYGPSGSPPIAFLDAVHDVGESYEDSEFYRFLLTRKE